MFRFFHFIVSNRQNRVKFEIFAYMITVRRIKVLTDGKRKLNIDNFQCSFKIEIDHKMTFSLFSPKTHSYFNAANANSNIKSIFSLKIILNCDFFNDNTILKEFNFMIFFLIFIPKKEKERKNSKIQLLYFVLISMIKYCF